MSWDAHASLSLHFLSFIFYPSRAFSQHLVLRAPRTPANCSWFVRLEAAMRYETMTLGSNVIRFPVELRAKPSIDLLIEVAPDSREVELIAEAFGFDAPGPDGRSKADRTMAETIAKTDLPADPKERRAALNAMLKPLVDRAVAACGEARQTALRSDEAGAKLANAQIEGGYWLAPLEDAANHWALESARLQLNAYEAAEAAHGAGRAIEFAKRGEPWRPSNVEEDVDALIAAQRALAR
jgi:hypothetical protein